MNTLPPLPLIDGCFFVSDSFLERLSTCPRSAEYYKLHARVASSANAALNTGKLVHKCLEMHYRLQEFNLEQAEVSARVGRLLEREFALAPNPDDDHRNLSWIAELYQRYVERHEFETIKLMQYKEPMPCKYCSIIEQDQEPKKDCDWCCNTRRLSLMVEVPFAFKLFTYYDPKTNEIPDMGLPIYYHGYIDLPVNIGNQPAVLDFKTTSMLGQGFFDDKKMSAQPKGYCAGFHATTGIMPAGYIVRAIRTSRPPEWVLNGGESKRGEKKNARQWWQESFQEERYILGEGELDEWRQNTIALVETFMWHYSRQYFPRETTSCIGKYGKCQYYDVCSVFPVADRQIILSSGLYTNKEQRDPLK